MALAARRGGGGLIPAHAGKTRRSLSTAKTARAHPRSRGENGYLPLSGHQDHGSSPLTRGKPLTAIVPRGTTGLIPAHAGKTHRRSAPNGIKKAHPRSRGENANQAFGTQQNKGSSPLTRGKPRHRLARNRLAGLIPAHAGKTTFRGASGHRGWAHPRSRGENATASARTSPQPGSSPLTRGKRCRRVRVRVP